MTPPARLPALNGQKPAHKTSGGQALRRLQSLVLGLQLFPAFAPGRIKGNAGNRTYLLALRLIEMPDAFGAFIRVDLINLRPHEDRVIRAFRLTHVAINAVVGNQQRHDLQPLSQSGSDLFLQPLFNRRKDKLRYIAP